MWFMIAAAALSVMQGAAQGAADQENADRQAALSEFEARMAEDEGKRKALSIYANSATIVAQQIGQTAASGVVVGDGSAQAVIDETHKLTFQDATATLYSSGRQAASLRAGSAAQRETGEDALLSGQLGGIANGVSSFGSMGGFSSFGSSTPSVGASRPINTPWGGR